MVFFALSLLVGVESSLVLMVFINSQSRSNNITLCCSFLGLYCMKALISIFNIDRYYACCHCMSDDLYPIILEICNVFSFLAPSDNHDGSTWKDIYISRMV